MQTNDPVAQARYTQLVHMFRAQILSGALGVGMRLPTEHEIAEQYAISRGTVRQALMVLANEGLIERVQGRGSTVLSRNVPSEAPAERRIGLVLNRPGAQLELDILVGVEQAARARGYRVTFIYTNDRIEQLAPDIAYLREDRAVGIIVSLDNDIVRDDTIAQLQRSGLPTVLVDRYMAEQDSDYVAADNRGGGFRATEHLLILGHTQIGFVYTSVGTRKTTSVRDRLLGYRHALEAYGVPYDESLVLCCPYPSEPPTDPPAALSAYVYRTNGPTAIFAVHDQVALHVLQAARQCGRRVPEDLALVGFDDLSYAAHLTPPLTTVAQQRSELGTRAANLLIDRIEGFTGPFQHIEVPTSLIIRESCGARLRVQQALRTRGTT
ncbi:MAG: GntR family transcriptional regulator [Roseiflexaceae bacterium]|nr:GntR family transcriptional regulator [Roseiflexaceae bacterium]